jgi:hypothetical protein
VRKEREQRRKIKAKNKSKCLAVSPHPRTIERPPTKPKKVKPLTKAMEEGKEPLRSFSDLLQLYDKKEKSKGSKSTTARS